MPTRRRHSLAAFRFAFLCEMWGMDKGWVFCTEGTGLQVDEFNGFVPDVVGFAPGTKLNPEAVFDGPPFLVAEVCSRSTGKIDRQQKMKVYAQAGVAVYVLIHPEKKVMEVYRLQDGAYGTPQSLSGEEVWEPSEMPGLRIPLVRLWM